MKRIRGRLIALTLFSCLVLVSPALGAPIIGTPQQWTSGSGGNDHWYELVQPSSAITWAAAKTAAEGMSHLGLQGYLATITSQSENDFIYTGLLLNTAGGLPAWIGASDAAVEGDWRWLTGPEAGTLFWQSGTGTITYDNWGSGEPNSGGGFVDEDYARLEPVNNVASRWNDASGSSSFYVVEYGGTAPIPEPATLLLLGTGLAGLGFIRRRKNAL